jgi:hypothetical protein
MKCAALIALLSTGCSFAFVSGPRPGRLPNEDPQCTRTLVLPLADGAVAAFGVLASLGAVTALPADPNDPDSEEASTTVKVAAGAIVLGTLLVAGSSIYGFSKVNHCKRAYRSYALGAQPSF